MNAKTALYQPVAERRSVAEVAALLGCVRQAVQAGERRAIRKIWCRQVQPSAKGLRA